MRLEKQHCPDLAIVKTLRILCLYLQQATSTENPKMSYFVHLSLFHLLPYGGTG